MFKLNSIIIGALSLLILAGSLIVSTRPASAIDVLNPSCNSPTTCQGACNNPNATKQPLICQDNNPNQTIANNSIFGPNGVITSAIQIIAVIIGVAAIIMLIIAGMRFIFGGDNPKAVGEARNGLIYALVGLAVAVFAQSIVSFVLNNIK